MKRNIKDNMKKLRKVISIFVIYYIMFGVGCLCFDKIGFLTKSKDAFFLGERNNAKNVGSEKNLNDGDAELLQDYIFGQWRFSKRLIALEESTYGENFSEQAIEEMKDFIVTYDEKFVLASGYDQKTFSNRKDILLYTEFGGDSEVNLPVYHVERNVDEDNICLQYGSYVQFPIECELIYVCYDLGYNVRNKPSVATDNYFADSIYVNLDDRNTIYLDFCGLWELKRVFDD